MGVLASFSLAGYCRRASRSGSSDLQIGQDRLAADGALADRHQGAVPGRQIEVDARAEADQAEPLADAHAVALADEGDDAPRDQAGDLHDRDLAAVGGGDDEAAPLVLLARLVEGGVEEAARHVDRADDAAGHRRAVDVDVEHGKEDRDPEALGLAEAELDRRAHALDGRDAPVGRRDDQALAQRRDAGRIAEEVGDPGRHQHRHPRQRRPEQEQQRARRRRRWPGTCSHRCGRARWLSVIVSNRLWRSDTRPPELVQDYAPHAAAPSAAHRVPRRRSARPHSLHRHGDETQVALAVLQAQQHGFAAGLLHLVDALGDIVDRCDGLLRHLDDDVADLDALLGGRAGRVDLAARSRPSRPCRCCACRAARR